MFEKVNTDILEELYHYFLEIGYQLYSAYKKASYVLKIYNVESSAYHLHFVPLFLVSTQNTNKSLVPSLGTMVSLVAPLT